MYGCMVDESRKGELINYRRPPFDGVILCRIVNVVSFNGIPAYINAIDEDGYDVFDKIECFEY